MKTLQFFALWLAAWLAVPGLMAATYYVSKTGSDLNPGTGTAPFLTVQKGLNTAQPGDLVRVGAGTYPQDVITQRSGTSNAPIVLDGQGLAVVQSFQLKHQFLTLRNFTIKGRTNYFTSLLYFNRGAHHCVISNNVVDGGFTPQVYPVNWCSPTTLPFGDDAGSDNLLVSNTVTRGMGVTMMSIMGDRNVILGNHLLDGAAVDWFRLWGRSNYIAANVCSNNFASAEAGNHPDFIQTFGNNRLGSRGHVIEGNLVIKIESGQLTQLTADLIPEIRDWTFRNNIFVDIAMQASCVIPGVSYYNNVFLRCNTTNGGHALMFTPRPYATGTDYAHGCRVFNNVFLDCGDSRIKVGWYYFATNLVDVAADYNYVGKLGHKPVYLDTRHRAIGDPGGWDSMCMAWWEPHGINGGNPQFVNEGIPNFHLFSGSPLIGAGTNLSGLFTGDFEGKVRGSQWDIGALEFEPGSLGLRPRPPSNLR